MANTDALLDWHWEYGMEATFDLLWTDGGPRWDQLFAGVEQGLKEGRFRHATEIIEGLEDRVFARGDKSLGNLWLRAGTFVLAETGHPEYALEWLAKTKAHALRSGDRNWIGAAQLLDLHVAHALGRDHEGIRHAHFFLGNREPASDQPWRTWVLILLGSFYLRTGQIGFAILCLERVLRNDTAFISPSARLSALCLRGDVEWWRYVHDHPKLPGQFSRTNSSAESDAAIYASAGRALEYYTQVSHQASEDTHYHRLARAGAAKARLLLEPVESDHREIEETWTRLSREGHTHECAKLSLALGVCNLLHNRSKAAAFWLEPLARRALSTPGLPLQHDALYFGALAAERNKNPESALAYFREASRRRCDANRDARWLPLDPTSILDPSGPDFRGRLLGISKAPNPGIAGSPGSCSDPWTALVADDRDGTLPNWDLEMGYGVQGQNGEHDSAPSTPDTESPSGCESGTHDYPSQANGATKRARRRRGAGRGVLPNWNEVLHEIDSYINLNIANVINVEDLAKAARCSRRTLEYAMQDKLATSPSRYVLQRRLEVAAECINFNSINSDADLQKLALAVGFKSIESLSRAYSARFGSSLRQAARDSKSAQDTMRNVERRSLKE